MPAKDQILLVHAYLDGELDAADALAVKAQLESDPRLAAEFAAADAVQKALRERFPPEPVPPALRQRISAIGKPGRVRPTWTALAASVLIAASLSGGGTWYALYPNLGDPIAAEVTDSHMRSLVASRPTEVETSERHVVKPWFNGRVPYAPRVVDLAAEGFPLVGARIDIIAKTPVPTLVYNRRLHVISLLALPASVTPRDVAGKRVDSGYNTIAWRAGETTYFATSDLNAEELGAFAKLFQAAPGG